MPARKRPEKLEPSPPEKDVRELQDPDQSEADFLRDLDKVATDDAKERLADRSEPDRGSPRT